MKTGDEDDTIGDTVKGSTTSTTSSKSKSSTAKPQRSRALSLFLQLGILFSFLDSCYIIYIVEGDYFRSERTSGMQSPPMQETPLESTSENITEAIDPIHRLVNDAGMTLSEEERQKLPKWEQVTALYGDKPIIVGLESCEVFRTKIGATDRLLGVAGTFNTGTNLMADLLAQNCQNSARMAEFGSEVKGIRWQVPWGKHTPIDDEQFRQTHKAENDGIQADQTFPIVTIRDPARWAASMCRHPYAATWPYRMKKHCPNLVPNEVDVGIDPSLQGKESIPVDIEYAKFTKHYDSLIDHWNKWYHDYMHANFPRVLIRFEDLVFHQKYVTQTVCECAGGELMKGPFHYIIESSKVGDGHGRERTGFLDAIVKYGNEEGRWKGMTEADIEYVKEHLDPELMNAFNYKYPA